jgi:DNA-binding LytR/AlgR family response regulator
MIDPETRAVASLRIFCLEDNPLIVFHLEQILDDLGHVFVGSAESFSDLCMRPDPLVADGALVDIDLSDGRMGPAAAAWLKTRNIPTIFVTGQEQIAAEHAHLAIGIIAKPVSAADLAVAIERFRDH